MDEIETDQPTVAAEAPVRRLALPHHRLADDREVARHELRERVAYYAPGLRPDTAMRHGHWDLDVLRGAPDDQAVLPVRVLVELLDRLDRPDPKETP